MIAIGDESIYIGNTEGQTQSELNLMLMPKFSKNKN